MAFQRQQCDPTGTGNVAALASATAREGSVDPTAYEPWRAAPAQPIARLIVNRCRPAGPPPPAVAGAVPFRQECLSERDRPAAGTAPSAGALNAANLIDNFPERQGERLTKRPTGCTATPVAGSIRPRLAYAASILALPARQHPAKTGFTDS